MASRAKRKRRDKGLEHPPGLEGLTKGPWPDFVASAREQGIVARGRRNMDIMHRLIRRTEETIFSQPNKYFGKGEIEKLAPLIPEIDLTQPNNT